MSAIKKFIKDTNAVESGLEEFMEMVYIEIKEFLNFKKPIGVLVFPPLNSRKRFFIHQIGQILFNVDTFSVGQYFDRRIVVCQEHLKTTRSDEYNVDMERKDNRKGAVAKIKRTNRPDAPIYIPPAIRRKNLEPSSSVNSEKGNQKAIKINGNNCKNLSDSDEKQNIFEKNANIVPENVISMCKEAIIVSNKCAPNVPIKHSVESDIPGSCNPVPDDCITDCNPVEININTSNNKNLDKNNKIYELWTDKENDQEEKELHRASEEINRKNRKIIKQSFSNSDILIINEHVHDMKLTNINQPSTKTTEAVDNWEDLLDDTTLESTLMLEIIENVGNVKVYSTKNSFDEYKECPPVLDSNYSHVLEIYDFPKVFQTRDLVTIIDSYKCKPFHIKWVDDSHALGVFSSGFAATEVLKHSHPLVKFRPLSQATKQSIFKATQHPDALLPSAIRPQTCPHTARRMVTGALGLRMQNSKEERAKEIKILKEAREKKRLSVKQQDDAWEGNPYPTSE